MLRPHVLSYAVSLYRNPPYRGKHAQRDQVADAIYAKLLADGVSPEKARPRSFAIATSRLQKLGYLKPGTVTPTHKGAGKIGALMRRNPKVLTRVEAGKIGALMRRNPKVLTRVEAEKKAVALLKRAEKLVPDYISGIVDETAFWKLRDSVDKLESDSYGAFTGDDAAQFTRAILRCYKDAEPARTAHRRGVYATELQKLREEKQRIEAPYSWLKNPDAVADVTAIMESLDKNWNNGAIRASLIGQLLAGVKRLRTETKATRGADKKILREITRNALGLLNSLQGKGTMLKHRKNPRKKLKRNGSGHVTHNGHVITIHNSVYTVQPYKKAFSGPDGFVRAKKWIDDHVKRESGQGWKLKKNPGGKKGLKSRKLRKNPHDVAAMKRAARAAGFDVNVRYGGGLVNVFLRDRNADVMTVCRMSDWFNQHYPEIKLFGGDVQAPGFCDYHLRWSDAQRAAYAAKRDEESKKRAATLAPTYEIVPRGGMFVKKNPRSRIRRTRNPKAGTWSNGITTSTLRAKDGKVVVTNVKRYLDRFVGGSHTPGWYAYFIYDDVGGPVSLWHVGPFNSRSGAKAAGKKRLKPMSNPRRRARRKNPTEVPPLVNVRTGDTVYWCGKKVFVVDTHGYGHNKTVDLRWTISRDSKTGHEVSGHKRGVSVHELGRSRNPRRKKNPGIVSPSEAKKGDLVEATVKGEKIVGRVIRKKADVLTVDFSGKHSDEDIGYIDFLLSKESKNQRLTWR